MTDQTNNEVGSDRRKGGDRRIAEDPNYSGPERRKGERRKGERRKHPRE